MHDIIKEFKELSYENRQAILTLTLSLRELQLLQEKQRIIKDLRSIKKTMFSLAAKNAYIYG